MDSHETHIVHPILVFGLIGLITYFSADYTDFIKSLIHKLVPGLLALLIKLVDGVIEVADCVDAVIHELLVLNGPHMGTRASIWLKYQGLEASAIIIGARHNHARHVDPRILILHFILDVYLQVWLI